MGFAAAGGVPGMMAAIVLPSAHLPDLDPGVNTTDRGPPLSTKEGKRTKVDEKI